MHSILKKIAVCKHYKENISMEAGVDPTNIRAASELACQLGYYLLRMFYTFAFRLHSAVYLHSVSLIGRQTRTLLKRQLYEHTLLDSTHAGAPTGRVPRRRAVRYSYRSNDSNKGLMWTHVARASQHEP